MNNLKLIFKIITHVTYFVMITLVNEIYQEVLDELGTITRYSFLIGECTPSRLIFPLPD